MTEVLLSSLCRAVCNTTTNTEIITFLLFPSYFLQSLQEYPSVIDLPNKPLITAGSSVYFRASTTGRKTGTSWGRGGRLALLHKSHYEVYDPGCQRPPPPPEQEESPKYINFLSAFFSISLSAHLTSALMRTAGIIQEVKDELSEGQKWTFC